MCLQQPTAVGGVDGPSILKKGRKRKGLWTFRSAAALLFEDKDAIRRRFLLGESRSATAERLKAKACTRLVGQRMRRTRAAVLADERAAGADRATRGAMFRTRHSTPW